MSGIIIERQISAQRQIELGIESWPVWEKGVTAFPWTYAESETCYLLEGEVEISPENAEPVLLCKGDLATFPRGMRCVWNISRTLAKHYTFG